MSSFTLQSQVSDIVTSIPQTADLFRSLRIDFCCGGQVPLEEAAKQRNLEPAAVLEKVQSWRTSLPIIRKAVRLH